MIWRKLLADSHLAAPPTKRRGAALGLKNGPGRGARAGGRVRCSVEGRPPSIQPKAAARDPSVGSRDPKRGQRCGGKEIVTNPPPLPSRGLQHVATTPGGGWEVATHHLGCLGRGPQG